MTVFAWILIVILGLDVIFRFVGVYITEDKKELKSHISNLFVDGLFLAFLTLFLMRY